MSWPATPLTTYVANTVPAIKAFDLNAFQNGINGIVNGTYSLKGLLIDGTGGAVSTPPAGSARVSRSVTGTSYPNIVVPLGEINVGQPLAGVAYVKADGTFLKGINVKTLSRVGLGHYRITWNIQLDTNGDGSFFSLATVQDLNPGIASCQLLGGTPSSLDVFTYSLLIAAADRNFVVAVFGG
jgi:hypothetical protein